MIYCTISELTRYISCSTNMKKAIDFIMTHNLNELPLGKTIIDGDKTADLLKYESHKNYIDIQIDLEGDETVFINNGNCDCIEPYKEEDDYALYSYCEPDLTVNLNQNYSAIIFPKEIHMPCVKNKAKTLIKCVVKVLDK